MAGFDKGAFTKKLRVSQFRQSMSVYILYVCLRADQHKLTTFYKKEKMITLLCEVNFDR